MNQKENLVWMDLEMTGLDPEQDVIIEIATIVTDKDLNIIAEGPVLAVHQPDVLLDAMDDWNTKTHGNSGLTKRVRESQTNARAAELQTLEFLQQYVKAGASPLCGNSIHQDRRFLVKYMPELEAYMHYRNIDVSTLKELAKRWKPEVVSSFNKKGAHQALDDIKESIDEMLHYRQHFLALD
ncbi:oligoribonuclease [Bacterioplanoides pacificum]|uniref:Oligoribonuclease n=1 Tax=Bacterioplanoides pacificum TaxID=1171596 RepID=A0ABV7VPY0_9GAMM